MLKRVTAPKEVQNIGIPIRDAAFPEPFPQGLEYASPARGTWNIVHTGMLIPQAHEIFVCAASCLRGVVLTAAELGAQDRFSTVENRWLMPSSAAVSTTPRRQLAAQTKISWASGISMPVWTMFQVPRAGEAYSSPEGKGLGKDASRTGMPVSCGLPPMRFSIPSPHRLPEWSSPKRGIPRPWGYWGRPPPRSCPAPRPPGPCHCG